MAEYFGPYFPEGYFGGEYWGGEGTGGGTVAVTMIMAAGIGDLRIDAQTQGQPPQQLPVRVAGGGVRARRRVRPVIAPQVELVPVGMVLTADVGAVTIGAAGLARAGMVLATEASATFGADAEVMPDLVAADNDFWLMAA